MVELCNKRCYYFRAVSRYLRRFEVASPWDKLFVINKKGFSGVLPIKQLLVNSPT